MNPNPGDTNTGLIGSVDISGNSHHMYAWNDYWGPMFSSEGDTPSGVGLSSFHDGHRDGYAWAEGLVGWSPSTWTIELSFKFDDLAGWRTLIGRDDPTTIPGDIAAALYIQSNGINDAIRLNFATVSNERIVVDTSLVPELGQWYHLAIVVDGDQINMYASQFDGLGFQNVGSFTMDGGVDHSLQPTGTWTFGRGWFDGNFVDHISGNLDNIRFSDLALTTDQFLLSTPKIDRNPVMNGADPDILLVDDTVWMYTTSGPRTQFFACSSNNLANWQTHGPILDFADIPWIPEDKHAWAPGVTQKNGMYYIYYSVGPKPSHIGVAYSSSPDGPFVDSGGPLLSDNNSLFFEAIDAMVFTDPHSGTSYLYAGGSAGSELRVFELNNDMISFAREITVSNPSQLTEGAFMHYHNGVYYLSYSHGSWDRDSYSVHYSTANSPVGPWVYRGALMVSDDRHKGPGHHSFLYNAAIDEWYIFYHRWNNRTGSGPYTGSRSIAIEKMQYAPDGSIQPFVLTDTGVGPVWLGNTLRADFNENGTVALEDLFYFSAVWLTADEKGDIAPVGGDGIVDLFDFAGFALQWLKEPQSL